MTMRETLAEAFAPEAVEFVAILAKDKYPATQDNYGRAMLLIGQLPDRDAKDGFIDAMVTAGYNAGTAESLRRLV